MFESIGLDWILFAQVSDHQSRDVLVAIISIGLGLNIAYAAITENARCFELASVRTVERSIGRYYTRFVLVGVGSLCIFMGAYLVAQSVDRKSSAEGLGALTFNGALEK